MHTFESFPSPSDNKMENSLPPSLPPSLRALEWIPPEGLDSVGPLDLFSLMDLDQNLTSMAFNLSQILNMTGGINVDLIQKFERNRRVGETAFYALIAAYSLLILVGATGNALVVAAVVRKPAMRTARNVFIINLAVSDLLLCMITMPLTLMELLTQYWPLGDTPFTCRLVGTLQATSIFVSTISITAIALDRYHVIVYPTKTSLKKVGAVVTLGGVWILSFLLALPNFVWRTLESHYVNLPGIEIVNYCFEDWPSTHGRAYYSVLVMLVQYCFPILTVSIAYSRICNKLKYRMTSSSSCRRLAQSRKEDGRMKKTNTLLIAIALIFCLSWLPLNLYNVIVDLHNPFGDDTESMMIVYAICHMTGMSSACSNPLLYGWLNDNFRKEFLEIFRIVCPFCADFAIASRINSLRNSRCTNEEGSRRAHSICNGPVFVLNSQPFPDETTCNGVDLQDPEVTFISQVTTTAF